MDTNIMKKADRKLLEYYAKLQKANNTKQAVCGQSLCDKKLRKRGALANS